LNFPNVIFLANPPREYVGFTTSLGIMRFLKRRAYRNYTLKIRNYTDNRENGKESMERKVISMSNI